MDSIVIVPDAGRSLFDEGLPPSCPDRFNLTAHTLAFANRTPDRIALEVVSDLNTPPASWTYADLREAVLRAAAGLRSAGISRGDKIVLRMGNVAEFPILYLAAAGIGAIPVPTSAMLTKEEVSYILDDLNAEAIVLGAEFVAATRPGTRQLKVADLMAAGDVISSPEDQWADTRAEDPAYIVYTSGTGGKPKGVVHAHRAAWARRMMWDGWYGLGQEDRVLHAGAFNWTYTLGTGLIDPWAVGATALIYNGPADRGIWAELASRLKPTIFAAAPGVYRQLLAAGTINAQAFSSLRHGLSAGEALPEQTRADWQQATGKPIHQALGMTEVSTYVSCSPTTAHKPGTIGRPQPGRRVAILGETGVQPLVRGETGLLAVSSRDPGLMTGYWNRPGDTGDQTRGEWFLTGDLASMDAQGYVAYHGRADDLMNAQGYRVSPQEVEHIMSAHNDILDCAVTEVLLRDGVSIIAAFVVPRDDHFDASALAGYCAARLARYKCPKQFIPVSTLPRSANGKLQRKALAASFSTDS